MINILLLSKINITILSKVENRSDKCFFQTVVLIIGYSNASSSSSIGTTTLRWVSACSTAVEHSQQEGFTECRCQRQSNPQLGGEPVIYSVPAFATRGPQLLTRHKRTQQRKVEIWARNGREILPKVASSTSILGSFTCRIARHGTDGFTSPPKEGVLRVFSPEKSDGFGRVWTP
jgi:hypothetical protein